MLRGPVQFERVRFASQVVPQNNQVIVRRSGIWKPDFLTAADIAGLGTSQVLTGTPTAPTAVQGTNTDQIATTAFVRSEVTALVNSAPTTLDTLGEIAAALASDESAAAALTTAVSGKLTAANNLSDVVDATTARANLGAGTVNSVGMTVPGILYTVTGSPITSNGTLALSLNVQPPNTVLAGPTTGVNAAPTMRALVAADMPGTLGVTSFSGTITSSPILSGGLGSTDYALKITPTYNQTSTAGATDLLINRTQTAVGSGIQRFIDCQIAGVSKASIDNSGFMWSLQGHFNLLYPFSGGTITVGPHGSSGPLSVVALSTGNVTNSSGIVNAVAITPIYNQTGTAGATDLYINRTQTAVGSGSQFLINCAIAGSSVFSVDTLGNINSNAAVSAAVMNGSSFRTGTTNQPTDFANRAFTTSGTIARVANATQSASSGTIYSLAITPTWNNTSTAGSVDLSINRTETAVGSGGNWYILCQTAGVTNFSVTNVGTVTSNNYYSTANDFSLGLQGRNFTGGNPGVAASTGIFSGGTGIQQTAFRISPTYNQTSTAGATDLLINRTETAIGSGNQRMIDCQVGGSSRWYVDRLGQMVAVGRNTTLGGTNAAAVMNFCRGLDGAVGGNVGFLASNTESNEFRIQNSSGGGYLTFFTNVSGAVAERVRIAGGGAAFSATDYGITITPTYNQTATASATDLFINRTETAIGSGTQRLIDAQVSGVSKFFVDRGSVIGINQLYSLSNDTTLLLQGRSFTGSTAGITASWGTFSGGTGIQQVAFKIAPIYNQTSTAGATDLLINRTETAIGSGVHYLIQCQRSGVDKFRVDNAGGVYTDAVVTNNGGTTTLTLNNRGFTAAGTAVTVSGTNTITNSSGTFNGLAITPAYSQTGTAAATDLLINRTQTTVGSGSQLFLDCQVAGASKTRIDNWGCIIRGSYAVAGLPSATGRTAGTLYATNGRKAGEGAGAGTGIPVWSDGTNWRTYYDNSVAAA